MDQNSLDICRIEGKNLDKSNISQYLPRGEKGLDEVKNDVQKIIDLVREKGDDGIKFYTEKFDGIDYSGLSVKVSEEEIKKSYKIVDIKLINALKNAIGNIDKFHQAQKKDDWFIDITQGVQAGQVYRPIKEVGLYIPGGKAIYPSSVLMTAIPAKVAGAERLAMVSPPQKNGHVAPSILVAADLCGVDEVFRCGGAQAIAALAYGTESIKPVKKIVGPGNKWVAAAKQLVANTCGIDNPAGPSDILLVADKTANPLWSAYDLLAQSEHGPDNVSVLISEDEEIIESILTSLYKITSQSPRKEIIQKNLEKTGLIIKSESHEETIRLINVVASEHLQLSVRDPRSWLKDINNAGAIFLGSKTPVPLGDYVAGTNHVLPTSGYSEFYSGLSLQDFMKEMDVLECTQKGVQNLYPSLEPIAEFEGLIGHRDCVKSRIENENENAANIKKKR